MVRIGVMSEARRRINRKKAMDRVLEDEEERRREENTLHEAKHLLWGLPGEEYIQYWEAYDRVHEEEQEELKKKAAEERMQERAKKV